MVYIMFYYHRRNAEGKWEEFCLEYPLVGNGQTAEQRAMITEDNLWRELQRENSDRQFNLVSLVVLLSSPVWFTFIIFNLYEIMTVVCLLPFILAFLGAAKN